MFYVLGLIRNTPLWGIISFFLLVILGISPQQIVCEATASNNTFFLFVLHSFILYPIFLFVHVILCRIRKSRTSVGELIVNSFISGLIAPFGKIWIFLLVITKKHIIQDDSTWHNIEDFAQVVLGFAWAMFLGTFVISGLLSA